ncbi:unnamed protein product [Taenia asiatica]|uniref:Transmembrane protein n=1 Tax=Taenia asiatica TaxID=60517 RepID=A0A0R3W7U9_TAEAS|nr:unnamed protein product [Taenia asiatica]
MPMFSEIMIDGVRKHKYSCVDTSPLSNYVLHPFWNYIVQYCPTWIAPNMLTIVGFGLTVLNFLMLTFYDWDFKSPCDTPRIIWLLSALLIFVAHTLGVFWLCAIPSSVFNVVVACNKDRTKVPTAEAVVRPFAGTVFVFLASWIWMTLSPTHIMEHSPRLFLLCGGTLAANITCRVILAEVTKTKPPMWCNLMGVYGLVILVLCLGLPSAAAAQLEFPCLLALTSLITVAHLLFSGAVVSAFSALFTSTNSFFIV